MKFYGNGIVWDGANNKVLCKFVDGVYDAKDLRIINILRKSYKYDVKDEIQEDFVQRVGDIKEPPAFTLTTASTEKVPTKAQKPRSHKKGVKK